MTTKVVLEYKRSFRDEGTCSGRVFLLTEEEKESDEVGFGSVEFESMLRLFGDHIRKYPEAEGWYRRLDTKEAPMLPWMPHHVEAFRSNLEGVIQELATPRTVTIAGGKNG